MTTTTTTTTSNPTGQPRINRANQILGGLLALQLVAALIMLVASTSVSAKPSGPLLADFAPESVTGITIRDASDAEIVLAKGEDGSWTMPGADNFPVREQPVSDLLNALRAMDTGRLVAQNASSQPRLKVADTAFERTVQISRGGDTTTLYVGTTSGGAGIHVRLSGQNDVYLVTDLSLYLVSTRPASWVNPVYFSVPREDLAAVTVENANGTFELVKEGEDWTLADLVEGETFNADGITTLMNHASSFSLDTPLGKENQESYGLDAPLATITIRTHHEPEPTAEATATEQVSSSLLDLPQVSSAEEAAQDATYTILIGAKLDDNGYVAKASNSEYYVKISNGVANAFLNLTRDSLLVPPATETPTPTPTPGS